MTFFPAAIWKVPAIWKIQAGYNDHSQNSWWKQKNARQLTIRRSANDRNVIAYGDSSSPLIEPRSESEATNLT